METAISEVSPVSVQQAVPQATPEQAEAVAGYINQFIVLPSRMVSAESLSRNVGMDENTFRRWVRETVARLGLKITYRIDYQKYNYCFNCMIRFGKTDFRCSKCRNSTRTYSHSNPRNRADWRKIFLPERA